MACASGSKAVAAADDAESEARALWRAPTFLAPEDVVFRLYGASVATYFAFVNHVTKALAFPSVLAFLLGLRRWQVWDWYGDDDVISIDDDPYMALYSTFMVGWSVLLLKTWRQRMAVLADEWGVPLGEPLQPLPENFRIHWVARLCRQCSSVGVTLLALAVAGVAHVCTLNLQGYVRPDAPGACWLERFFHIPCLAALADPGAVFDPAASGLLCWVPTLLHLSAVALLNRGYMGVAARLTRWEAHECEEDAYVALAAKRFGFEFFDSFGALLYIAFVRFDLLGVRSELTGVFATEQLVRVCLSSLLPIGRIRMREGLGRRSNGNIEGEALKEEYDDFDDYLEIVLQLSYLLLFAVAFPLAALAALACNLVEIKSDLFKLAHVVQKPERRDVIGIRVWDGILVALCLAATITNSALFSLSSHQLQHWLPSLFLEEQEGAAHGAELAQGSGRYVVAICFAIEHGFLLLVGLLYAAVPDTPRSLRWKALQRNAKEE